MTSTAEERFLQALSTDYGRYPKIQSIGLKGARRYFRVTLSLIPVEIIADRH
jgi:hypothetical protein